MKKFAVFDIDGTLIRWQLYHAVVNELAKQGMLGNNAYEELKQARLYWKERKDPNAFKAYEEKLIDIYEQALTSIAVKDFDQLAEKVTDEYKHQVHVFTRDLIEDLKSKDYMIFAISGSHTELIAPIARVFGFDDWSGTVY